MTNKMDRQGTRTALEVIHEDIVAPEAMQVTVEAIKERLNAVNNAEVTDSIPLPKLTVPKGAGKIDLSSGLKRHFREHPEKLEQLYDSIITRAIQGDHNATKLVFDRVEGAVPQRVGVGQLSTEQIAEMLQLDVERGD